MTIMTKMPVPTGVVKRGVVILLAVLVAGVRPETSFAQERPQHVVTAGETLFRISRTYGVSVDDIRRANGLTGDDIKVGQVLVIPDPVATNANESPTPVEPQPSDQVVDTSDSATDDVGDGDPAAGQIESPQPPPVAWMEAAAGQSLYDIAFAIGLSADSLSALNPALPTFLSAGDGIRVPKALATVMHGVRRGDTLFKIAAEYGTTVEELRRANAITSDVIHVGQVIMVPAARTAVVGPTTLPTAGTGVARQYPSRFAGRLMAGGREYDPEAYTISHRDLPIGSLVLLTSEDGERVFAEVGDRLPSSADYMVDVSKAVATALALAGSNPEVEVYVVRFGSSTR